MSVTWVKFVTCFYENFFAIAFIALKKKKKNTRNNSHFLHSTLEMQWQNGGVISSHGNEQESHRMVWSHLSDENLFSSTYYESKTTSDILFQFKQGWAVGQLLQIITSTEITSYQKTTRVRLCKNESRKIWTSQIQAYFWSDPVKNSVFIFFSWGISCLSWGKV